MGELVRPLALSGRQGLPLGPCLGSVVADRLLDTAAVVALFGAGAWLGPLSGPGFARTLVLRNTALVAAAAVIAGVAIMLVVSARGTRIDRWLERRGRWTRWVGRSFVSLSAGASALASPRLAWRIGVHTLLAWLTIALATWVGVLAAGASVPFTGVLIILPLLVLGVAVPTPGGTGSYHGLMKVGLMLLGVGEIEAVGAALLVHAAITVPVILLGLALLWVEGISWRHLVEGARNVRGLGASGAGPPAETAAGGLP
jgi:hypothetical protein